MSDTGVAVDEESRLRALASLLLVDAPPQAALDHVVQVASVVCGAPIALVSLVERDRLYFMARAGLKVEQLPSERSLCNYAIRTPRTMLEVRDASCDPRFADSPSVTGVLGIRFYAGVPLVTSEGEAIGTLCVMDRQPRVLSESQRVALDYLAQLTIELLESRRREFLLQQRLADLDPA